MLDFEKISMCDLCDELSAYDGIKCDSIGAEIICNDCPDIRICGFCLLKTSQFEQSTYLRDDE